MAPSNVFSYLRPHHRRTTSQPTTPEPPLSANSVNSPAAHYQDNPPPPRLHDNASNHSSSPVSPFPPILPPIPRIASRSKKEHAGNTSQGGAPGPDGHLQAQPSPDSGASADSGRDARRRQSSSAISAPTGLRVKGQRPNYSSHSAEQPSTFAAAESSASTSMPTSSPFMSQSSLPSVLSAAEKSASGKGSSSGQHSRSKKSFNLRNPMSLLLRRRSGQALANLSDESLVSHRSQVVPAMALADDFDPSIRGNIVHDFSAPKSRRTHSYDAHIRDSRLDAEAKQQTDDESPSKRDRSHTPVFKEEFDTTESEDKKRESAVRAETLANQDFLARNAFPEQPDHPPPPPPPFAKRRSLPPPLQLDSDAAGLAPVPEASPSPTTGSPNGSNAIKTPPQSRSRATSGSMDPNFQPAGLPMHLTSRASRFSFQIAGVNSSEQEKLLEERHKQRAAAKAREKADSKLAGEDEYGDEEEDMYDYDNMDDGGYEEEIPMLGDDYGDGFGGFSSDTGLADSLPAYDFSSFNRVPYTNPLSPIAASDTLGTPADVQGNALSNAMMQGLAQAQQPSPLGAHPVTADEESETNVHGLGLMDVGPGAGDGNIGAGHLTPEASPAFPQEPGSKGPVLEDDDFYFDDGLLDEPSPEDGENTFDESAFDDPNSGLYERPAPVPKSLPQEDAEAARVSEENPDAQEEQEPAKHALAPHPSMKQLPRNVQSGDPFDFKSPADYFSALAEAATKAEAEGRFVRKNSVATTTDVSIYSQDDEAEQTRPATAAVRESTESAPSLVQDSSRVSGATENFLASMYPDTDYESFDQDFGGDPCGASYGDDYGDYDSALEDDPMIAAANAEALANDFDGEYGSEFGFYANAYNSGAEVVNGGYFGPSGLGRSVSGRNAVREPNLTPITERSEYSTRNSFIGLGHFAGPGSANPALPSPGLAQLARMSPYGFSPGEDEFPDYDMSLEQLMKLRKGAFGAGAGPTSSPGGGSAASSPRNSSPLSYFPNSFQHRATSPVATRGKSAWDAMQGIEERQSDSDEGEDRIRGQAQGIQDEDDEALVNEANGSDESEPESTYSVQREDNSSRANRSASDLNDETPHHASPSPSPASFQRPGVPHQIQTRNLPQHINTAAAAAYDPYAYPFLPENPGNIPVSVPASAISTTSTSSLPFGHSASASTASAGLAPPSQNNHQQQQQQRPTSSDGAAATPLALPSPVAGSPLTPTLFSPLSPPAQTPGPASPVWDRAHSSAHSRTSSGAAESVTYVRERIGIKSTEGGGVGGAVGEGESERGKEGDKGRGEGDVEGRIGGGRSEGEGADGYRWVMERRRTSNSGEMELVGREVVRGGRI